MKFLDDLKILGERIFEANGHEFRRGFNACHEIVDILYKKSTVYNNHLLLDEIRKLNRQIQDISNMKVAEFHIDGILSQKIQNQQNHITGLEAKIVKLNEKIEALKQVTHRPIVAINLEKPLMKVVERLPYQKPPKMKVFNDFNDFGEEFKVFFSADA